MSRRDRLGMNEGGTGWFDPQAKEEPDGSTQRQREPPGTDLTKLGHIRNSISKISMLLLK